MSIWTETSDRYLKNISERDAEFWDNQRCIACHEFHPCDVRCEDHSRFVHQLAEFVPETLHDPFEHLFQVYYDDDYVRHLLRVWK